MTKKELDKKVLTSYLVEEKVKELFLNKEIGGTLHLARGQEAIDVATICAADNPLVFGTHRSHGQYLARTDDIEGFFDQIFKGMSQHLYSYDKFMSGGIQGGLMPVAVGNALAFKKNKIDRRVLCFIGDGTFGEGICYESLNLAVLFEAPITFVLIDNGYSMGKSMFPFTFEYFSEGYPIDSFVFDKPLDSELIYNKIKKNSLLEHNTYPNILYFKSKRICGHSISDTQRYRPKEELSKEYIEKYDPINHIDIDEKDKIETENRINEYFKNRNK
jgi:TPP-dependent pyruvate/acetoin dehydrogenase alpha subunit